MTVPKAPQQFTPARPTEQQIPAPRSGGRVVVGADCSYWGQIALRWAAEHAWMAGAALEVHKPPVALGATADEDRLGRILRGFPMLPVAVGTGADAAAELVSASRGADLVVLGCRGDDHRGIGVGSAVAPVVAGAACDVMVIGGRPAAVRGTNRRISVLLGTDNDQYALTSAAHFAMLRRVPLRILLATPLVGPHPLRAPLDEHLAMLENAEAIVHRVEPAVRTTSQVMWSSPHEMVGRIDDTDILVLGLPQRLDSVTRIALHHAASPVLVAHRSERSRHQLDVRPATASSLR
jgi:nucleotide-binding universal stress UspA family protein